jgi:hypothetical protein
MKLRGKKSWIIKKKKDAVKMNSVRLKNSGPQSLKGKQMESAVMRTRLIYSRNKK